MKIRTGILVLLQVALCITAGAKDSISAEQRKFFENKIRPVLVERCHKCHAKGAKKVGAKLFLDTAEGLRQGGESGTTLVSGKPNDSLLVHALRWQNDLEMPPKEPLPPQVIADFEKWIAMGAPDPRVGKAEKVEPRKAIDFAKYKKGELWSFQPVANPKIPSLKNPDWARGDIDRFVLAKMEQQDLLPATDAPSRNLARRIHFDLIGLPPTFEEQSKFGADFGKDPQAAVASLVDELLDSPHFGERWGRHWLDVARYAESNGNDGLSRNASFPNAWRYRDYVIDALNRDLPFDQFITEQIAGDLLKADSDEERDRQLIATGFLALGSKPAKAMNNNFAMDVVADQIDVVSSGLLGLSVACARCHDHKFDPIPTRDYYAMAGFFTSSETLWGIAANERLTAPPTQLHVLKTHTVVSAPPAALKLMKETEAKEMRNYARPKKELTYPPGTPLAMGMRDRKQPADCKINLKGDAKKLGGVVPRGFLTAYPDKTLNKIEVESSSSGRRELARWITSPNHPQTSRVMVNRIWMHLFGQAIVGTPNDFGVYGEKPTHPELLDFLAGRFSRGHHWSIKSMIREIVLSRTYQLDSLASPESVTKDPENRWLSRHLQRRLDAESIRDAMLAVSGSLNPEPAEGSAIRHLELLVNRAPNLHEASDHRSIYLCMMRNSPPAELAAFDLPNAVKPIGKRDETMLPTQGLFLLNSDFVVDQAKALAASLSPELSPEIQVRSLWKRVLNREPSATEISEALYLLENEDSGVNSREVLSQALLVTNEFRYVD